MKNSTLFLLSLQFILPSAMASATPLADASDPLPRLGALGVGFTPLAPEQATTLKLPAGSGLVALEPQPNMTAANAGIRSGDVLLKINGKQVGPGVVAPLVRELPSGKPITFSVMREGKSLELTANLVERPRDPGNSRYEVIYSHIVSNGQRMRTIITKPRKTGVYPGFFFIQGFSPVSYDFTLATAKGDVTTIDGPLLHDFASSDFVTIRVEKPGVGDSEGGPFAEMDFITEIDIYRQTLKQLKELKETDTNTVFIFGHSMGGAFGPIIASENPVRGIAVYGTAARTWFEYLIDTIRYQGLVAGSSFAQADQSVRIGSRVMALVMLERKSPAEVKAAVPSLAPYVDAYFPGGLFNGKSLDFWRQLNDINFPEYWDKLDAHVLAVKGASDFVVYEADHKLIADIMNRKRPGTGNWEVLPKSDHLFHDFETEAESQRKFSQGNFTLAFSTRMKEWIRGVMAKPQ